MRLGSALLLALCAPLAGQGMTLDQLAAIAHKRLEAGRARQAQALAPYIPLLASPYHTAEERQALNEKFDQAAAQGDIIVEPLLELLTPKYEDDTKQQRIAANAARILSRLDPAGFVDPLLELARNSRKSPTASSLAIGLLAKSRSPVAAAGLIDMLDGLGGEQLTAAVEALTELKGFGAATKVAGLLGRNNQRLRRATLQYLTAAGSAEPAKMVRDALGLEESADLIRLYVGYFEAACHGDAESADALLAVRSKPMIGRTERTLITRALGEVAPRGHLPTIAACRADLDANETGDLGLACAMTMLALGDKEGVNTLASNLRSKIKDSRRDPTPYECRGRLYMALERWPLAIQDFEDAIQRSTTPIERKLLQIQIARCEARRRNWNSVARALRDSGASSARILNEAAGDEALRKALETKAVKRVIDGLRREEARGGRR